MTIKQYKKKYFICKDDNGKMIYAGDTVELHLPHETKSTYQSIVNWNRVDGAFVDSHPAHVQLHGGKNYSRFLREYLGKKECPLYYEDGSMKMEYTKCVKVKNFY